MSTMRMTPRRSAAVMNEPASTRLPSWASMRMSASWKSVSARCGVDDGLEREPQATFGDGADDVLGNARILLPALVALPVAAIDGYGAYAVAARLFERDGGVADRLARRDACCGMITALTETLIETGRRPCRSTDRAACRENARQATTHLLVVALRQDDTEFRARDAAEVVGLAHDLRSSPAASASTTSPVSKPRAILITSMCSIATITKAACSPVMRLFSMA